MAFLFYEILIYFCILTIPCLNEERREPDKTENLVKEQREMMKINNKYGSHAVGLSENGEQ